MNNLTEPNQVAEVRSVQDASTVRVVALRTLAQIKELKDQQKLLNEQKKSIMDNDPDLASQLEAAEEAMDNIKAAKATIKVSEAYAQLESKSKEIKGELSELGEGLTNHLITYSQMTGTNYIEDETGKSLKIKHKVSVRSGQQTLF